MHFKTSYLYHSFTVLVRTQKQSRIEKLFVGQLTGINLDD